MPPAALAKAQISSVTSFNCFYRNYLCLWVHAGGDKKFDDTYFLFLVVEVGVFLSLTNVSTIDS